MSIVSSSAIIAYLSASSYTANIQAIHEGVEKFVKNITGQPWESTTFTNKKYDGSGGQILRLEEIPIISVKSVIINAYDVIRISNTMADASLTSVVVDATNVTLTVEGGAGNGSDTLAKATYTTLTLLVDAINAQSANGWSAEILLSAYNSLKTSYLFDQQIDVTPEDGVANQFEYLQLGEHAENIKVKNATGEIYSAGGFPPGFQNIVVTYTAGYTTVPSDISFFILNAVKGLYAKFGNDAEGVARWQVGDVSMSYVETELSQLGIDIPRQIFSNYNRITI